MSLPSVQERTFVLSPPTMVPSVWGVIHLSTVLRHAAGWESDSPLASCPSSGMPAHLPRSAGALRAQNNRPCMGEAIDCCQRIAECWPTADGCCRTRSSPGLGRRVHCRVGCFNLASSLAWMGLNDSHADLLRQRLACHHRALASLRRGCLM